MVIAGASSNDKVLARPITPDQVDTDSPKPGIG